MSKPGYQTHTLYLDAVPARAMWGNFGGVVAGVAFAPYGDDEVMFTLLGGAAIAGLSFAIDAMIGAAWMLEPGRVKVKLTPAEAAGANDTPLARPLLDRLFAGAISRQWPG